jgi:hypothetical protein
LKNTGKKDKEDLAKVGSLLTAERSVWSTRVEVVDVLSNGEQKLTTRPGWGCEGVTLRAIEEIDGKFWLVTTGIPRPPAPPIPDGRRLLLDLINLVKQPIPWERVDEAVSAEDACTWCNTYGLPAAESFNTRDGHRAQLSFSLFQREVLTLRLLWDVSMELIDPYPDKATLARDLPQLWKARASQRREATDYWRERLRSEAALMAKRSHSELVSLARLGVEDLVNEQLAQVPITFFWDDPALRLSPVASSLFHIAYVQMASLLTKPDDESTDYRMQNLKKCEICKHFFWGHGNRRYCQRPCNKDKAYHHKTRGRQKAASARPKQAKSL